MRLDIYIYIYFASSSDGTCVVVFFVTYIERKDLTEKSR